MSDEAKSNIELQAGTASGRAVAPAAEIILKVEIESGKASANHTKAAEVD